MVKIMDVGQTMRAPGLYRVANDYVIKERVNVNPYNMADDRRSGLVGFSRRAWFLERAEMVRLVYSALYKVWGTAVDLETDHLRLLWLNSGRVTIIAFYWTRSH